MDKGIYVDLPSQAHQGEVEISVPSHRKRLILDASVRSITRTLRS